MVLTSRGEPHVVTGFCRQLRWRCRGQTTRSRDSTAGKSRSCF